MNITISKLNNTYMKISCEEQYMEMDIQDRFSFEIQNKQHDPRVKKGQWDGIIKLFNRQTKKLYVGLLNELIMFLEKQEYTFELDPNLLPDMDEAFLEEDLDNVIKELIKPVNDEGEPLDLYDYQIDSTLYAMNMGRSVSLAATSSGKSLIIYILVRLYQLLSEMSGKRIVIVVPSIMLVEQLYDNFKEYSDNGEGWHVSQYCQKISNKYTKVFEKSVVITTWQSMSKISLDVYDEIGMIICDEVHTAKAKELKNIMEAAVNVPFRHGFTGTFDGVECNELIVQGLFGPAKRVVTAKQLIESGRASKISIEMLMLDYSAKKKSEYLDVISSVPPKRKYEAEIQWLMSHEDRRDFILDIVDEFEGNTLVLFDRVEVFGKELYESYKLRESKDSYLIVGGVDSLERERIRKTVEHVENSVVFASYGTMSTGVSIKKLHNLLFISSSKSVIRILQSIGRLMRLHATKDQANIYDLVDNLTTSDGPNYMMKHAIDRVSIYENEEFDIKFIQLPFGQDII